MLGVESLSPVLASDPGLELDVIGLMAGSVEGDKPVSVSLPGELLELPPGISALVA